jgi:hypothetical protein
VGTGNATTVAPRSMTTARAEKDLNIWVVQTLVALNPTAFGGSYQQQPDREMVPPVQLLFAWRIGIPSGL